MALSSAKKHAKSPLDNGSNSIVAGSLHHADMTLEATLSFVGRKVMSQRARYMSLEAIARER